MDKIYIVMEHPLFRFEWEWHWAWGIIVFLRSWVIHELFFLMWISMQWGRKWRTSLNSSKMTKCWGQGGKQQGRPKTSTQESKEPQLREITVSFTRKCLWSLEKYNTVNAVNFAGLNFRVWQHKNIYSRVVKFALSRYSLDIFVLHKYLTKMTYNDTFTSN